MNLLKEISDGLIPSRKMLEGFNERKAARAVLVDEKGRVALLHVSSKGYYKLPGGGVKHGEGLLDALSRELLELTGCSADVKGEIGVIVEYRHKPKLHQISHGFYAKVKECESPKVLENNSSHGFKLEWVELGEALKLLDVDNPGDYEAGFNVKRDLTFLRRFRRIISG